MAVPGKINETLRSLSNDALVTVVHVMNRFLRYSIAVKAYDELRASGSEPAETGPNHNTALEILREIERIEGAPIDKLENDRIEDYITDIDRLLWQRIGRHTFGTKKAEELLSSLRTGARKSRRPQLPGG